MRLADPTTLRSIPDRLKPVPLGPADWWKDRFRSISRLLKNSMFFLGLGRAISIDSRPDISQSFAEPEHASILRSLPSLDGLQSWLYRSPYHRAQPDQAVGSGATGEPVEALAAEMLALLRD